MSRRFPLGLTISTAIALAILIGLGAWQVKRLAWKTDMLARIEALQHAPAQPLGAVLARARNGEDVEFTRVAVECPGIATAPYEQIYSVIGGQVASRLVSPCRLAAEHYDGVLVDRGYVLDTISARPPVTTDTTPLRLEGVLRKGDDKPARSGSGIASVGEDKPANGARVWFGRDLTALAKALGLQKPAPYFLMAETSSNPEWKALRPAAIPADIPNNHLSYAITWFGLAAALVGVYAALLRRKMQGR
jgi:surfeit locus 1 family protein